ncbi:serine hydrolase-like protein [Xylocopa sonorina]|uniref:serine hydrolase-like protein n=1 Tax=Xylocopa sonorina TaxID=1818115 RepID=UPI00403AC577
MDQMHEFLEVKFPVPWGHIAAKIYGPQKERKVLMVHGVLDNAGTYDRLIKYLPQDYQYVCIDLPGHGFSSQFPPGLPLNFFDYVHVILLVLDALKWKTCIYIGHSLGAQLGTYFSILYPGRLEKIVAFDGFLPVVVQDIIYHIRTMYNLKLYTKESSRLYTEDEVLHALQFRRKEVLKLDAAKALFKRSVTKVNDLYKYNRDVRLKFLVRPVFKMEQQKEIFAKYSTKTLVFKPNRLDDYHLRLPDISDTNIITVVRVNGNHDIHNNYPERVAPHVCQFLNNNLQSKL